MRFIGNKKNLISKIYNIFERYIGKDFNLNKPPLFFDYFSGSTSVGRFFKKLGYQIYSCDLLYFSYCLQKAYLANNIEPQFEKLNDILKDSNQNLFATPYQKVLEFLNNLKGKEGFIYQHYAPSGSRNLSIPRMYFSDENARKIDDIRLQIELWNKADKITENEYFILLATLIESLSFFANIAGVYAAFCKTWDKRALKSFHLKEIEILPSKIEHFCFCNDSLNILEKYKNTHFDILYLDPPYNSRQYAPNYHLVETIARYDNPHIKGVSGLRGWSKQKSGFCNAKSALLELEKIANYKNYKYLILSYNSEGIMQKEEISKILNPLGNLYFKEIQYPRFKSNSHNNKKYINEYVWILISNNK